MILEGSTNRITFFHIFYHGGLMITALLINLYSNYADYMFFVILNMIFRFLLYSYYLAPTTFADMDEIESSLYSFHCISVMGVVGYKIFSECEDMWLHISIFLFYCMVMFVSLLYSRRDWVVPIKKLKVE